MTIGGAIAELQNLLKVDDVPFYYKGGIQKVIETIQMDIPKQADDLISRADAIKAIARLHILNDEGEIRRAYKLNPHSTITDFEDTLVSAFDAIYDIPSAQPNIVRCKDCKWLRYCETEDLDVDFYLICDKPDGGGIPRSEEWFCADGERSES